MTSSDRQLARLSAAARAFAALAIGAPILWSGSNEALLTLGCLVLVLAVGLVVEVRARTLLLPTLVAEAALLGAVAAVGMQAEPAFLGALAIMPLAGGLRLGTRGLALTMSAQLVAFLASAWAAAAPLTQAQGLDTFTWSVTGLGVGLIASHIHLTLRGAGDPLQPYRHAQALIRELIGLASGLRSGLDPQALGGEILGRVGDAVPTAVAVLFLPRDSSLTPLVSSRVGDASAVTVCEAVAGRALARRETVVEGQLFAFPLLADGGDVVAVVAGALSDGLDAGRVDLRARVRALLPELEANAVQLDTALLFLSFRDAATADERRRLAREMHDGVAQDIVYLGYLVDSLAARPASPEQGDSLALLRSRITAVVSEVRRSVETLRTSVGAAESLGSAIGGLARNLSEVSGIPIQVTADEHTARLRPEVEAELFRITQEALNNAVKHSGATSIDVHCQVHAPSALITVADNGRGMREQPRKDSYGLTIMRERAHLVNAELLIEDRPSGGLRVEVRLPAHAAATA